MSSKQFPTTNLEQQLVANGSRFIIGIDEVGRGSIAGPVAVGVALIDSWNLDIEGYPRAVMDSKLMTEKARESTFVELQNWLTGFAVGMADAKFIDEQGIIAALSKSAALALDQLLSRDNLRSEFVRDGVTIILDGSHNWLAEQAAGLSVVVREKADRDCVVVAAASVLAKVQRDRLMIELAKKYPEYGFEGHKGYASAKHIDALQKKGPSDVHRLSWLTKILSGQFQPGHESGTSDQGESTVAAKV